MVIAPEHPHLDGLMPAVLNAADVEAYKTATTKKSERERSENKEKTGVQLQGIYAFNPATLKEIPIFVADYVLGSYGTGAVMGVPAHDERDFEFASKNPLIEIISVIEPLFKKDDGDDAVRELEPFKKRDAVACVIKHWGRRQVFNSQMEKT